MGYFQPNIFSFLILFFRFNSESFSANCKDHKKRAIVHITSLKSGQSIDIRPNMNITLQFVDRKKYRLPISFAHAFCMGGTDILLNYLLPASSGNTRSEKMN
jgi:hypothetical protein